MLRIVRRSLAGHSKWANIRHKKGGKDAAKADQFQKLAKVIETSSKLAGGDRSHPALASALSRAKDARMPKRTVDAAVTRGGADKTAGAGLEELVYEGTLPGGVGVIVDALSDNKNRTAGEVRATFKKHGGALGAPSAGGRGRRGVPFAAAARALARRAASWDIGGRGGWGALGLGAVDLAARSVSRAARLMMTFYRSVMACVERCGHSSASVPMGASQSLGESATRPSPASIS